MQPLEWSKQFICVFHVKSDSVVFYIKDSLLTGKSYPEFNYSIRIPAGKFESVIKKIRQKYFQQIFITGCMNFLRYDKLNYPVGGFCNFFIIVSNFFCQVAKIYNLKCHLISCNS